MGARCSGHRLGLWNRSSWVRIPARAYLCDVLAISACIHSNAVVFTTYFTLLLFKLKKIKAHACLDDISAKLLHVWYSQISMRYVSWTYSCTLVCCIVVYLLFPVPVQIKHLEQTDVFLRTNQYVIMFKTFSAQMEKWRFTKSAHSFKTCSPNSLLHSDLGGGSNF
jgi:hypothetical protein